MILWPKLSFLTEIPVCKHDLKTENMSAADRFKSHSEIKVTLIVLFCKHSQFVHTYQFKHTYPAVLFMLCDTLITYTFGQHNLTCKADLFKVMPVISKRSDLILMGVWKKQLSRLEFFIFQCDEDQECHFSEPGQSSTDRSWLADVGQSNCFASHKQVPSLCSQVSSQVPSPKLQKLNSILSPKEVICTTLIYEIYQNCECLITFYLLLKITL